MDTTPQARGSRTGRATHVACPRCTLSYQATIWQVFEDVPGSCPRCLGLHGVEQAMTWVGAPKGPPTTRTPGAEVADPPRARQ